MASARVYLFSGTLDTVVNTGVVQKLQAYYASFVNAPEFKTVYDIPAEHSLVRNKLNIQTPLHPFIAHEL